MKEIQRNVYLDRLISRRENGVIKVITGIRRCGKSYLLDPIFKNYLIQSGVKEDHIIKLELDKEENKKYHDSHVLNEYIKSLIKDKEMYYILLDEIQLVEGFEAVLNGFLYERNLDVYVTGSQKCLNAPQGCPLVCFSKKAIDKMNSLKGNKKFYFSMALENNPEFLFVRGLNDLFENLLEEGMENVYKRHFIAAKAVREGIKALGLDYMAEDEIASPSTTRIVFFKDLQRQIDEDREMYGIDQDRVTKIMKDKYGVCIAEDRIGTMGFYTREEDVLKTIEALGNTLEELGYLSNKKDALNRVKEVYKSMN